MVVFVFKLYLIALMNSNNLVAKINFSSFDCFAVKRERKKGNKKYGRKEGRERRERDGGRDGERRRFL